MEIFGRKIRFKIIFMIDVVLLLFVQVLQGASLNYFFIKKYEEYFTTYFLFILDFLCSCLFGGTFYISYKHFTGSRDRIQITARDGLQYFSESIYGVLPLSYMSWMVYVGILIAKLSIIFGTDTVYAMAKELKEVDVSGSQILQVSVAASSITFMLLVEGHNWHKKSSECYSYVTAVCKKTGIEIFDSVEMLDFILTTDKLSKPVENTVFILACINFVLPTLSLYTLSISNFGKCVTKKSLPLRITHSVTRLLLIDIPFFIVRFHTWIVHKEITVFMMKNLFYILLAIRELYLDLFLYFKPNKSSSTDEPKFEEIPLSNEQTQTDSKN